MTRTGRSLAGLIAVGALALGSLGATTEVASGADPVPADPNAVITFLVGLPHLEKALEAAAKAASTPGTKAFRHYLTVKKASATFGASRKAELALVAAARKAGLVARVDATRLFARVIGTVAAWQKVMGQPVKFYPATAGSAQGSKMAPFNTYGFGTPNLDTFAAAPSALKSSITWFIPTYMQYVAALDVAGVDRAKSTRTLIYPDDGTQLAPTNGGSPLGQSCLPAEVAPYVFTPSQISHAYGLGGLQQDVEVVEPRIAVLSLGGGFAQTDVDASAACFGHRSPTVDIRTGLGIDTPIVSLSGESALDLQTVSFAARELANIRFVQVVNSPVGFIEAYSIALTGWPTPPDAITDSWGACESERASVGGSMETVESLLKLAAVVGTSAFAASGDRGSSACQSEGIDPANPIPTIQYPSSSPFMTAVGGTQLNLGAGNVRIGESVWNDLQYGVTGNAVGTGGPSQLFDAPWYQRSLTGSDVRSVPDIAAQAGVTPGTAIYIGGSLAGPTGGTSQASPLAAAGFAMVSARLRDEDEAPLGFINPWLYQIARSHDDVMYDITIGNNQYPVLYAPSSANIPACCQAGPGFDAASGLGAPLFNKLVDYLNRGLVK